MHLDRALAANIDLTSVKSTFWIHACQVWLVISTCIEVTLNQHTMPAGRLLPWQREPELVAVSVPEPGPGEVLLVYARWGCGACWLLPAGEG